LNNKSKDENVDDVETEEGEKRETTRIQTAPAEETADEWGRLFHLPLLPQFESKRIYVSIYSRGWDADNFRVLDASKTPPSRFQQKKGSVYATPNSRDSHIDRHADRDSKFHELHDKKFGSGKGKNGSPKGEA
jgi:hypothetical protein